MLRLPDPVEQRKVEDFVADPGGGRLSFVLDIAGEDYGDRITTGGNQAEWGTGDDGVCYLECALSTVLPRRLEEAPVKFYVVANGVRIPQVFGVDSLSEVGEDRASTDPFHSASPGRLANEYTLDEDVEVIGWPPERVVRKAVSKLPYTRTRVEPVTEPSLYFARADETDFKREQHPADMLSSVASKAPYVYRDTFTGGFVASVSLALGKGGEPLRIYDADDIRGSGDSSGDEGGWRPPPRAEPRHSRVVVFRRNPDDSMAFEASASVAYRGSSFPPKGRTLYVALEDPTPQAPARAQSLAYDLATRAKKGVYKDELMLPGLDPLIEKGDAFRVEEFARDAETSWQRAWLCWVEYKKNDPATASTALGYAAMLVEESEVKVPVLLMPGLTGGVYRTFAPPLGNDALGVWYLAPPLAASAGGFAFDPALAQDASGDPWMGTDSVGGWTDPAISGGNAAADAGGFGFGEDALADLYFAVDATGAWADEALSGGKTGHDADGFWIDA